MRAPPTLHTSCKGRTREKLRSYLLGIAVAQMMAIIEEGPIVLRNKQWSVYDFE